MKSEMPVSTSCWKVTSDSRIRMAKKRRKKHRYATSLRFDTKTDASRGTGKQPSRDNLLPCTKRVRLNAKDQTSGERGTGLKDYPHVLVLTRGTMLWYLRICQQSYAWCLHERSSSDAFTNILARRLWPWAGVGSKDHGASGSNVFGWVPAFLSLPIKRIENNQ